MDKDIEKKEYELSFIVKEKSAAEEIESAINQHSGEITDRGEARETKLSYPIEKNKIGYFGFYHFRLLPSEIERFTHSLALNPMILRHLVVTPPIVRGGVRKDRPITKITVEKSGTAVSEKSAPKTGRDILTNEALEEKLEEILK